MHAKAGWRGRNRQCGHPIRVVSHDEVHRGDTGAVRRLERPGQQRGAGDGRQQHGPRRRLPEAIADYHRAYPSVQISYSDLTTAAQLQGLRGGAIDVAFIRAEGGTGGDLDAIPIDREPLVLALSPGHRLAAQAIITARELETRRTRRDRTAR